MHPPGGVLPARIQASSVWSLAGLTELREVAAGPTIRTVLRQRRAAKRRSPPPAKLLADLADAWGDPRRARSEGRPGGG